MVATKAANGGSKPPHRGGYHAVGNRQRFKPGTGKPQHQQLNARHLGAMFNVNQLDDNPGFVDFNDDLQIPDANGGGGPVAGTSASSAPAAAASADAGEGASTAAASGTANGPKGGPNRKPNHNNLKRTLKNGLNMRHRMPPGPNGPWRPPLPPPHHMFNGPPPMGRRGGVGPLHPPLPPPPHFRVPPGMRMRGGLGMPPPGRFGMSPPGPMSLLGMNRPLPHPIPPMGRPLPPPPMGGRMIPPPLRLAPDGGPMRRNLNGKIIPRGPPIKAGGFLNGGQHLNGKKAKTKPMHQSREEFPLDKPWVTDDIRAAHDKKVELTNRLKGNRDDALFAQFKEQRDRFVKMYEAARLEFIGKHPEQDVDKILTESACEPAGKAGSPSSTAAEAAKPATVPPAATDNPTTTSVTSSSTAVTTAAKADAIPTSNEAAATAATAAAAASSTATPSSSSP